MTTCTRWPWWKRVISLPGNIERIELAEIQVSEPRLVNGDSGEGANLPDGVCRGLFAALVFLWLYITDSSRCEVLDVHFGRCLRKPASRSCV
jgi:hypothetical protein